MRVKCDHTRVCGGSGECEKKATLTLLHKRFSFRFHLKPRKYEKKLCVVVKSFLVLFKFFTKKIIFSKNFFEKVFIFKNFIFGREKFF